MGISAFLLARDEADRIGPCLESLTWVDEVVVVVDASTTDDTAEICRRAGARVIVQPWLGFSRQQQVGLDHTTQEWVLLLAADERVSLRLRGEIQDLLAAGPGYDAYEIPSCNLFWGKKLRSWYPDRHLRLFRREDGHFPEKAVHEYWAPFPRPIRIGCLKGDLIHDSYRNLQHCIDKWVRYAELAAPEIAKQHQVRSIWPAIGNGVFDFVKYHILKRGFLDGAAGLTYNLVHAYYMYLTYALAYEINVHGHTVPPTGMPGEPISGNAEKDDVTWANV